MQKSSPSKNYPPNSIEESNRIKSNFLKAMGHELRIPLNTILGMAQIMQSKQLNFIEQRDCSNTIFESGLELLTLINDIIDFSHSEKGSLKITPLPLDLRQLIEQVVKKISHKAHTKSIQLALDYDNAVPRIILSDPQRIRQVLSNLIDNAIKFTEQGHVLIEVKIESALGKTPELRIAIVDTGIGIAPEHLSQIFTQVDPISSFGNDPQNYQNQGLGLELRLGLVKQIVELMGGNIQVTSQPNEGSTFSFTLPLEEPTAVAENTKVLENLNGINALVIDDNEAPTHILQRHLTSAKMTFNTIPIGNALTTLQNLQQEHKPYQLIIISAQTFDHHIAYLVRTIRNNTALNDIMLTLALSSQPLDYEVEQAITSGFACVLNPLHTSNFIPNLATTWQSWNEKNTFSNHNNKHQVLLVEDNQLNQKVAKLMLENLGCNIDIAATGQAALQLLEQKSYDIIFMDLGLPDTSGLEVTSEFRKREDQQHRTPIIALTAYTLDDAQQASFAAGVDDYLPKPLLQDQLNAVFAQWTKVKHTATA